MLRRGAQRLSTRSEGWVLPNADLRVRFQDARHHVARSASIDGSRYLPHRSVTRISAILSVRHVAPRWRDGSDDHRRQSMSIGGGSPPATPTARRTNSQVRENATSWGA
jgi:hypothetical protein